MARRGRRLALSIVALGVVLGTVAVARAAFHLIWISEIYAGSLDDPSAQFVELQMLGGQNFTSGHTLTIYTPGGAPAQTITFTNVAFGADQDSILIGTAQVSSSFGVSPDFSMNPVIQAAGGAVCYEGTPDCATWGSWSGSGIPDSTGSPFNAGEGIPLGAGMERIITGGSDSEKLDFTDDTDDSAADFELAGPTPRNNAGTVGAACCTVGFSAAEYSADEGTSATITVTRNVSAGSLVVDYSTADGTAHAGSDYAASSGTLSFAYGETAKEFFVPILADSVDEADETVLLQLRNPTAGVFSRPGATLRIIGNLQPPSAPRNLAATPTGLGRTLLMWDPPVSDGGSPVTAYELYRSRPLGSMALLATVAATQTSYTDTTCRLLTMTVCTYWVAATNQAGEGPMSDPARMVGTTLP